MTLCDKHRRLCVEIIGARYNYQRHLLELLGDKELVEVATLAARCILHELERGAEILGNEGDLATAIRAAHCILHDLERASSGPSRDQAGAES